MIIEQGIKVHIEISICITLDDNKACVHVFLEIEK